MEERGTKERFNSIFDRRFFQYKDKSGIFEFFSWRKRKKIYSASSKVVILILIFASIASNMGTSRATTLTLPDADISAGYSEYNNISLGANNNSVSLQAGNLGSWNNEDSPLDVPDLLNYPDMQYGLSNTIYMLTGTNSGNFKRYWVEERRWEDLAQLPFANFSRLIFDGSRYLYTIASSGFYFYRYDTYTNIWEKMPDTPYELMAGSNLEYVNIGGGYVYALRGGNTGSFWRYSVQNGNWEPLLTSSYLITSGSSMMWDRGAYLYIIRGGDARSLYRYEISTGTWVNRGNFYTNIYDTTKTRMIYINSNEFLTINSAGYFSKYFVNTNTFTRILPSPAIPATGMSLTYDGSSRVYVTTGGYGDNQGNMRYYNYGTGQWDDGAMSFPSGSYYYYDAYAYDGADTEYQMVLRNLSKKDLNTGAVTALPPMPSEYSSGAYEYIVVVGTKLYFAVYGYSGFYQYDISANSWSDPLTSLPANMSAFGGSMINGGDGYIYVSRGGSTQTFWRYNIAGNGWEVLTNIPFAMNHAGGIIKVGTKIYALQGLESSGGMASYDMSTLTWTTEKFATTTLGAPQYMSRISSNGTDTIYVMAGSNGTLTDYARRIYSYNTTTQIWSRMADLPQYVRGLPFGTIFYRSGNVYVMRGDSDLRIWEWTSSATAYKTSGTWFSKHYDLTQVSSFDSLTYGLNGSGSYQLYTRTSDNLANWDSWVAVSGNTVGSTPKRYFQFKVVLTGDGTQTRTLTNFALNYSQEVTPPSIPTEFHAYSDRNGVAIVSGTTYPYHHPYFTWAGSGDGVNGSGVAGYYVYFGTDPNADPVTSGSYQTGTSYYSNTAFTAGDIDYLRIKVKDNLGNISNATTMFSYRYWFVSPPSSAAVATLAEFQQGTSTNVDVADVNGAATLNHRPEGSWSDGDLAKMPQLFKGGAAAYSSNGNIYALMGNGTQYFYRYDIEANLWLRIADVPVVIPNSANGAIMRWDGNDTIYAIPGANSIAFYKYIISRNQWVRLNDLPSPAGPESAIGLMGNNHFIVSLNYSTINYIYDATIDSFDENTPAPGNFTTSTNLYFDGVDTVYAMMELNWLRKFVISENRWYSLMRAPAYFGDSQNISFEGLGNDLYMYASRNAHQYMAAKYSISDNQFEQITSPPMETSQTSYIVTDNTRYVYILQNCVDSFRQDNMMIRYDTVLDKYTPDIYSPGRSYYYDRSASWDSGGIYGFENAKPFYTSDWSSMAFDGVDTVYYKGYDTIVSYSVSNKRQINSWKNIYYNYGHIAYSSGYLYMTIGSGSNRFVRQNLKTYEWEELANAPGNLNQAYTQNLLVDSTGRLYVAQAGGSKVIYRYLPASNTWETIADAPIALNTGSNMVYDGSNRIYFTFGGTTSREYYYYNISSNGWVSRANIIDDIPGSGAVQMYNNGKVYLLKGKALNTMSVYDTDANTWVAGPVAPTTVNRGSGFVAVNSEFALMAPAGAKSAVWRFNYPDATKGNNSYGTYTSKNFLIEGVFSYVGLEANLNIPDNTAILFQTRTTADGTTWSNWQDVSDKKLSSSHLLAQINSPLQKNIQVRAMLISYNGYDSPTLYDFKVNYFSDTSPPNNPTVLKVYQNDQKLVELTNNTWYNTAQPYIDWPEPGEAGGATDGVVGSNITGYYIYVGPDVAAVPESQGVLVNVSNYQPTLATSGLYYINIQAVDGSGNVAEAVFSPYLYKLDIDKPANPASISSDPAGYSNTNSFSFTWPVAQDTHSGVKEYCYKTAATEGAYSVEQCQSGTSISAIPAAYQQGANILYVRAHDYADNFSDSTQEVTFYFNSGPPSRPSNLTVDPVNTIQNNFTFNWDPPAAYIGNVDKISYFYSINALPSISNTTRVETRSIGPAAFATQAGANGFYLVAKDESGNIDWNAYASVTFYANTVAPGVPVNPTIADISSRASSRWALAISWDQPANLGSGVDHYIIERSTDKFRYNQIGTAVPPAFVDTVVSENIEYYYRIKAVDSVDNPSPASSVVSLSPTGKYAEPPEILSEPDVEIGSNQVTIRWQTNRPCFGYVNYGTAHDKLLDNKGSNEEISDHAVTIAGIMANTVYYYKIQNFDADREYELSNSYSILRTFRSKQSPVIQDVKVSDIKLDSALVSWSAQSIVSYNILYGKSVFYGLSKEGNTTSENVSVSLTDLEHSSNYHFKIVAMSIDGDEIRSDDYNFNTMSYPQAYDIKFQPVDGPTTSVEVSWKTNVAATSIVSYQIGADIKEQSDGAYVTEHKIVITDLADNAEYRIQIRGVDEYGNNVVSEAATWRTAVDTRAPIVTNIKVDPTYNSSGNKSQLIVTWETDEPSSSQIEFGTFGKDKGYQSKNTNDVNLTTKHIMIIPDLETATSYHLRPLSGDKSGNIGYGQDTIAVIGQNQKSFVRAIFKMFESLFSWLSINQ